MTLREVMLGTCSWCLCVLTSQDWSRVVMSHPHAPFNSYCQTWHLGENWPGGVETADVVAGSYLGCALTPFTLPTR